MNETSAIPEKHNLTLKSRRELLLDGVLDVSGFDENSVALKTAMGSMVIDGQNLHITKMSLETGEVKVEGTVTGIFYEAERDAKPTGFFRRIFK